MSGIIFTEDYAPNTPLSGRVIMYAKDDGLIYIKNDTGSEMVVVGQKDSEQRSIYIELPTTAEDISLFFVDQAITIYKMNCIVQGTTPSLTWTVRHGPDRDAAGIEVVTGGTTTTSTTTGDIITSFDDATIPASSHVWFETTARSGTVASVNLTLFYTED